MKGGVLNKFSFARRQYFNEVATAQWWGRGMLQYHKVLRAVLQFNSIGIPIISWDAIMVDDKPPIRGQCKVVRSSTNFGELDEIIERYNRLKSPVPFETVLYDDKLSISKLASTGTSIFFKLFEFQDNILYAYAISPVTIEYRIFISGTRRLNDIPIRSEHLSEALDYLESSIPYKYRNDGLLQAILGEKF